jgi:hypothetical protein
MKKSLEYNEMLEKGEKKVKRRTVCRMEEIFHLVL